MHYFLRGALAFSLVTISVAINATSSEVKEEWKCLLRENRLLLLCDRPEFIKILNATFGGDCSRNCRGPSLGDFRLSIEDYNRTYWEMITACNGNLLCDLPIARYMHRGCPTSGMFPTDYVKIFYQCEIEKSTTIKITTPTSTENDAEGYTTKSIQESTTHYYDNHGNEGMTTNPIDVPTDVDTEDGQGYPGDGNGCCAFQISWFTTITMVTGVFIARIWQ